MLTTKQKLTMYGNRNYLPKFCIKAHDNYILLALPMIKYFDFRGGLAYCVTTDGQKYYIESDMKSLCKIKVFRHFICIDTQFVTNPLHTSNVIDKGDRWCIHFSDGEKFSVLKIKQPAQPVNSFKPVSAFY
jgi:hypothetical protein